jgi:hypothetical protein
MESDMESTPMPTPSAAETPAAPRFFHDLLNLFGLRNRSLLTLSAIAGFALLWWLGSVFDIPQHRILGSSLLTQPSAGLIVLSLIVTAAGVIVCTVLGMVLAGTVRFDVGLFAAAVGLVGLYCRGGPGGVVLRAPGAGRGTFVAFGIELLLLYAMLLLGAAIQRLALARHVLKADLSRDGFEEPDENLGQKITATVATMLAMVVGLSLLAQTDDKAQVLWAVGLSALGGAAIAHTLFPVRPNGWYLAAPLLIGAIGYLVAFFYPVGIDSGVLAGQFAPLARPLPLDYAGAGTAGALVGYWMSRKWHHARQLSGE